MTNSAPGTAPAPGSNADILGEWYGFPGKITLYRNRLEYVPGFLQESVVVFLRNITGVDGPTWIRRQVTIRTAATRYKLTAGGKTKELYRAIIDAMSAVP